MKNENELLRNGKMKNDLLRSCSQALTTQSHLESIQDRIKLAEPQLIFGRQHACMSQVVGEHHLLHLEMIW